MLLKEYPCEKVGYSSFAEAQAALNRIRHRHVFKEGRRVNRQKKKKKLQRSYKCDRCGLWHLTSQVAKIKKTK